MREQDLIDCHRALSEKTARLAAAERVVEAAREVDQRFPTDDQLGAFGLVTIIPVPRRKLTEALAAYDAAVPARGEARAPEGGSTPPAAICPNCGAEDGPFHCAKPQNLNSGDAK